MNTPLSESMLSAGFNVETQQKASASRDFLAELIPQSYMTTEEAHTLACGVVQEW